MNCVFCCVFNQEEYVNMFYLLLESIYIYGNIKDDIQILVYTSNEFMNKIKHSHLYSENIVFEINDDYNDIDKSCKSRLDLFELSATQKYQKVLYLDTDIIVKKDLHTIFEICVDDIMYCLEEGFIDHIYWGKTLFEDGFKNYIDHSAFTSGILLFNNCFIIKQLFDTIKKDIIERPYNFECFDQPYIVYNSFKYNLYNNKILKSYVINNDCDVNGDKIIYHFPGGPGVHEHKIKIMKEFLNGIKDITINDNICNAKHYIDVNIKPIIQECGEQHEGNIFMIHHSTEYTDVYENKAKNISNLLLNNNIKHVLEIGFNSGFSTLLMLLSNKNVSITCYDLGEHSYMIPCFNKLKESFGERIQMNVGDSTVTLSNDSNKYDLIHIDGGHATEVAESDIVNSYRLSKQGTILIMDDYDFDNLRPLWDSYVNQYNLQPLDINLYTSPHHDVKYVGSQITKNNFSKKIP
jgi:predicted O-methyltransferase YrrM